MAKSTLANIPILYIIKICKWFMLYMPVVKLFYEENHLTDFDLFFLHAVYSAVIFIVEVPSGYLSDVWGRKKTLALGLLLGLAGFITYSLSYGLLGFLIAEIALGIGQGFVSGTDSALLYDSLYQEKKHKQYIKYEGRITASGNFSEALAGIAVTVLAFEYIRHYYQLQIVFFAIASIIAWFLVEPKTHKADTEVQWNSIISIVKDTLWKNKILSRFILFSAIIGFASLTMAWFAQIYLFEAGIKKAHFGILWTVLNLMVAIGSYTSHKIDQVFHKQHSLFYILIFLSGGYFLASQFISVYGIGLLLIFYFVRGTAHPILKDRINSLTSSNIRATVLSVRSLIIRILFAGLGPLLGWYTDKLSLSFALALCGLVILVPGIILISSLYKNSKSL